MEITKIRILGARRNIDGLMWRRKYYNLIYNKILSDIDGLSYMIDVFEESIDQNTEQFAKWLSQHTKKLSEEQKKQINELYSDDFAQIAITFPRHYHDSTLMFIYSFFEVSLNKICDFVNTSSTALRYFDLAGKGIFRARLYLEKVNNIDISTEIWSRKCDFNKIRNLLVHENGYIKKNDIKKIEEIARRNEGISVDFNRIIVDAKYLKDILETVKSFFFEIDQNMP